MSERDDVWLAWAERIDALRVFPRLFVVGYGLIAYEVWHWVRGLPDITASQAAFTTTVLGLCIPLLGWYFNTGRKWAP